MLTTAVYEDEAPHVGGATAGAGDNLEGVFARSQCRRRRVHRLALQRETKIMIPHVLCENPGERSGGEGDVNIPMWCRLSLGYRGKLHIGKCCRTRTSRKTRSPVSLTQFVQKLKVSLERGTALIHNFVGCCLINFMYLALAAVHQCRVC